MASRAQMTDANGQTLEQHRANHLQHGGPVANVDGAPAMVGRCYSSPRARSWRWGIRFVPADRGVERFEDWSRFEPVAAVAA